MYRTIPQSLDGTIWCVVPLLYIAEELATLYLLSRSLLHFVTNKVIDIQSNKKIKWKKKRIKNAS